MPSISDDKISWVQVSIDNMLTMKMIQSNRNRGQSILNDTFRNNAQILHDFIQGKAIDIL